MITQREVEDNGIVYIITEDDENPDFFIQEPKDKGEPEPESTPEQRRITQLEQQLAQTNQDLAAVLEMILG